MLFDIVNEWVPGNVNENECVIICNDFNIDFSNANNCELNYVNHFLFNIGLRQLVEEPTRITATSNTLIDYVLSDYTVRADVKLRRDFKILFLDSQIKLSLLNATRIGLLVNLIISFYVSQVSEHQHFCPGLNSA